MKKPWKVSFLITLEGRRNPTMTKQVARDKLFTPIQELWRTGDVVQIHIGEITSDILLIKIKNMLTHGEEEKEDKRESFYKTGFPKRKTKKNNG